MGLDTKSTQEISNAEISGEVSPKLIQIFWSKKGRKKMKEKSADTAAACLTSRPEKKRDMKEREEERNKKKLAYQKRRKLGEKGSAGMSYQD